MNRITTIIAIFVVLVIMALSCTKQPEPILVTGISLNATSLALTEGDSQSLTATISPSNADNKTVLWSSSNGSIATVDNGNVTAISAGTATITAKSEEGGKTATCSLTVNPKIISVSSVELDKSTITLKVGETAKVTATVKPDNATDKSVVWSTSDEKIATIKDGTITAVALGSATITAKAGDKSAECKVTVEATPVESVSLDKTSVELKVGEEAALTATVKPDNATDKTVTWASSDENIATVKDGKVTAVAFGSAIVTAKAGDKNAECKVIVKSIVEPLCFTSNEEQAVRIPNIRSQYLEYSFDQQEWNKWYGEPITFGIAGKNSIYVRGINPDGVSSQMSSMRFSFMSNALVEASGNVMSLINYSKETDSVPDWGFANLFYKCEVLTTFPDLPATNLSWECYNSMFMMCTSLTEAPSLPATTLAKFCYNRMFEGCTSLTKAPELPATTLAESCYAEMFSGCTSLTSAPELPSQDLAVGCYGGMFLGCTGLTSAPTLPAPTVEGYAYSGMFQNCTSLTKAPELPAATLHDSCYSRMFSGCSSLTEAPALPATDLGVCNNCYYRMFAGCTSLTEAPTLPATKLAPHCYEEMFFGCTNLKVAPDLPATTLKDYCYYQMFAGCTSLATAPELPATTLEYYCYGSMFQDCTSLSSAPALPAWKLEGNCYKYMFNGCTSLNYIKAMFTTKPTDAYTKEWVRGVNSTGTFVKKANATWDVQGDNGIPSGWTVQTSKQ